MFMLAWIFGTFWTKMAVLWQNRGKGGAMLTPTFLLLGIVTYVPLFGENQSRKCHRGSADRQRHKQGQRQTELFIICTMLCYAIAMGQLIRNLCQTDQASAAGLSAKRITRYDWYETDCNG